MPYTSREIRLASRPTGEPQPSNFTLAEVEVAEPAEGELVVRNTFMSVDPYMRGRMAEKSYAQVYEIDKVLFGGAVGDVVASNAEGFEPGDVIVHQQGWREYSTIAAKHAQKAPKSGLSESAYLGVLGMTGLTAYVGLLDIAGLKDGDVVFVSGAAGAVGSLAGQIAKHKGHTVIGSAGSAEKVTHLLDDLGFDHAFNYNDGPVFKQLRAAAPDGIDVYFDNVGGEHLEAAIGVLKTHGRVALCGAISGYNATDPQPGPRNMQLAIGNRLTLRGFIISDHTDRFGAFAQEVGGWVANGDVQFRETVVEGGIEAAPQALIDLLNGANLGKMVVRLG